MWEAATFATSSGVPAATNLSAFLAAFRAEVDDPVGALDDLEIVLDHDDRIARFDQALEQSDEKRNIIEVQSGRRLVEDEQVSGFSFPVSGLAKVPDEFQPLRFAAGESVERLAKAQITESDFLQDCERTGEPFAFVEFAEKMHRLAHGQFEQFVDRVAAQLHFQDMRLEPSTFAFRAAHVEVAQELHFDFLEAGPAAALATSAAGVKGKRARSQSLRHRFRQRGEKFAHPIVNPEIKDRGRTRGAGERRLIDHYDLAHAMRPGHALAGAGFFAARSACSEEILVKDFVDEGRFARAGDTGHTGENA